METIKCNTEQQGWLEVRIRPAIKINCVFVEAHVFESENLLIC